MFQTVGVSGPYGFNASDGPYGVFAGKDATRALATFSLADEIKDGYDDVSDLSSSQMESVKEWEEQFKGERGRTLPHTPKILL